MSRCPVFLFLLLLLLAHFLLLLLRHLFRFCHVVFYVGAYMYGIACMGFRAPILLLVLLLLCLQVLNLCEQRRSLQEYLSAKMDLVSPNLKAVVGDVLGARLISHAGALVSLAKYPASTIQILGAEKVKCYE